MRGDRGQGPVHEGLALTALLMLSAAVAVPMLTRGGPDRVPPDAAPASPAANATNGTSPTPTISLPPGTYLTDCSELRAGDALVDVPNLYCDSDDVQKVTMDCMNGMYVLLVRPEGEDLEALVGETPHWLRAGPLDTHGGRTEFAFHNCHEHE